MGKGFFEKVLKIIQYTVLGTVSFYASLLTISSFNNDIKSLLDLPKKIDKIESEMKNSISSIDGKQLYLLEKVNEINESASRVHATSFDENGYRVIRIRKASKEPEAIDKNSIYYDSRSKFFPQLAKGRNIRDYKVELYNMDNIFSPAIRLQLRSRTNENSKKNDTDVTFQVSKAIFYTLGGGLSDEYLEVKAKVVQ